MGEAVGGWERSSARTAAGSRPFFSTTNKHKQMFV
jgi:hypothetical protein